MDLTNQFDINQKLVLLGGHKVGKTMIIQQLTQNLYDDYYLPTSGADLVPFTINKNNQRFKLQLWDVGGDELFRIKRMSKLYLQANTAYILVYDINDQESIEKLEETHKLIIEILKLGEQQVKEFPIFYVGNKNDLTKNCKEKEKELEKIRENQKEIKKKQKLKLEQIVDIKFQFKNKVCKQQKGLSLFYKNIFRKEIIYDILRTSQNLENFQIKVLKNHFQCSAKNHDVVQNIFTEICEKTNEYYLKFPEK